jgi:hypothetical protein
MSSEKAVFQIYQDAGCWAGTEENSIKANKPIPKLPLLKKEREPSVCVSLFSLLKRREIIEGDGFNLFICITYGLCSKAVIQ